MTTKDLRQICVFCASAFGTEPAYLQEAQLLGQSIARSGCGVVYGGAKVGLMGAVADSALAEGGEVIGVLPEALSGREIAHAGLTELHMVGTMHERKALMASRADAFVILPGGFGTFDEFMEILTWAQLRIHSKPIVLINTLGYYDGLLQFLDHAVHQGFLKQKNKDLLLVAKNAEEAVAIALEHCSANGADPALKNLP